MALRLIGDLGGTNCRLALSEAGGAPEQLCSLRAADFPTLEEAVQHYLEEVKASPDEACLAVAGPVSETRFQMTNVDWQCDRLALQRQFGIQQLAFINDFEAIALSLPALQDADLMALGGSIDLSAPMAVLGPGTGLGAALLIPCDGHFKAISTEGGHTSLQAENEIEQQVFAYWREQGIPLSRESFLSGIGLYRLYQAIAHISHQPLRANNGGDVSALAEAGDATACHAIAMFMGLLGSAAGDQALGSGARGGIFLAGGILPKLRQHLANSDFRQRFENKAPMAHYLRPIAVRLVLHDNPGLLGASQYTLP